MTTAKAHAKINLALVVGPLRRDGKHEVLTVLQRVALHDDITLEPANETTVEGYPDDTLVHSTLSALERVAEVVHGWAVRIEKRIPVAAGLGGGSADAAAALALANATLDEPLPPSRLHALAAQVGADVPFFLRSGPQLGQADGTELTPLALTRDYAVLLVVPDGIEKESTASVYAEFDRRNGAVGFEQRRSRVRELVESLVDVDGLAALPGNDLASSALADELRELRAFRADVSGAGPTVYGLFRHRNEALRAEEAMRERGRTFVTHPV